MEVREAAGPVVVEDQRKCNMDLDGVIHHKRCSTRMMWRKNYYRGSPCTRGYDHCVQGWFRSKTYWRPDMEGESSHKKCWGLHGACCNARMRYLLPQGDYHND